MGVKHHVLGVAPALLAAMGCASGNTASDAGDLPDDDAGTIADASCGDQCDGDGDGVVDGSDDCPNTPAGEPVNEVGCADSQVTPTLEETFPPYGMTWTPTGDLGRAGGLTWTYTDIDRGDLFHIYWLVCDDPATPCGLSLDGPIDQAGEGWQFSPTSNLAGGVLVFTNTTQVVLADSSTVALNGRLTVTIVDAADTPIPFVPVATLNVPARDGEYGAEIAGTGFRVVALAEVQDSTAVWTPYLDYYDAAPTPDPAGGVYTSIAGSFYDE
jgi:hypothetical protein